MHARPLLVLCFIVGGALPSGNATASDTLPVAPKTAKAPASEEKSHPQTPPAMPRATDAKSPAKPPTAQKYRWEIADNESLTLVGPCGIVWRLNYGAKLTRPYFHPLQTADGRCLTWVSPKDHPWHYGLWHSWKFIDRVNYWEEDQAGGHAAGKTSIVACKILRTDEAGAHARLELEYFPADHPEAVAMADTIDLTIETPRDDGSYRIFWEQISRVRRPVLLDRTPLPGEPNGKDYGGYAGLSFRGDRFMRDVAIITSAGKRNLEGQRLPAQWAALTGTIDGQPAGMAIFDHPSNPRHPTPWYFVLHKNKGNVPNSPFWYINAAFLNAQAFELTPEHPLTLRYLVRVDSQPPPPYVLADEFQTFAASRPSSTSPAHEN